MVPYLLIFRKVIEHDYKRVTGSANRLEATICFLRSLGEEVPQSGVTDADVDVIHDGLYAPGDFGGEKIQGKHSLKEIGFGVPHIRELRTNHDNLSFFLRQKRRHITLSDSVFGCSGVLDLCHPGDDVQHSKQVRRFLDHLPVNRWETERVEILCIQVLQTLVHYIHLPQSLELLPIDSFD